MVLVPLVFTSIVTGVANLRAHDQMHRVWKLTLIFFFATMGIAILIGFGAAHVFRPGEACNWRCSPTPPPNFQARQMPLPDYIAQFMRGLFQNPFKALAQGRDSRHRHRCALFLGIALVAGGERYRNIRTLMEELQELCLRIVGWIMHLAPIGLAALLLQLVASQQSALLVSLGHFIVVVTGTTLFHGLIVLPLILWLFTRISPLRFFRAPARRCSPLSSPVPAPPRCR